MYCAKCGKEIKDGARFCGNCRAPVGVQNIQPEIKADRADKQRTTQAMNRMVIAVVVVLMIGGVIALILNITKNIPYSLLSMM